MTGRIMLRTVCRGQTLWDSILLYPGVALDCAFASGGTCGGVEAPNWNACKPSCGNTVLDAGQLTFLKDAADRIGSYLADPHIAATSRQILHGQLDELTAAIADHQSHPASRTSQDQR